jgi:hypothetical protein
MQGLTARLSNRSRTIWHINFLRNYPVEPKRKRPAAKRRLQKAPADKG